MTFSVSNAALTPALSGATIDTWRDERLLAIFRTALDMGSSASLEAFTKKEIALRRVWPSMG